MPVFVYVLRCADGSLYAGWTTDLERRLRAHRASRGSKYTRSRLPVELAAVFPLATRTEARSFEAKFKALSRAEKLKLLDPFGGRAPTSHERMSGEPWDASYRNGPAPWDIGKPQPAFARLASSAALRGSVLDAGCGTGENALRVAALGLPVLGVDVAETAVAIARAKAAERGVTAQFLVGDALELGHLGRTFETVLDCGLFHTFDAEERTRYVTSLASVTKADAMLYVLCFRDAGPESGPHPVREDEIGAAFTERAGWAVLNIEPERVMTRFHGETGAPAWLATLKRLQLPR